jgi:hypothetical protein
MKNRSHLVHAVLGLSLVLAFAPCLAAQKYGLNMDLVHPAPTTTSDIVQKAINTGVQWIYVPVPWYEVEPVGSGTTYWGPAAGRYHDYNFSGLDIAVNGLTAAGVNIVLQLAWQPAWAGGARCDASPTPPDNTTECGIIYQSHRTSFYNNFYDLAYNLALRYPEVQYWAIGNEPNTDKMFSPEPPLEGNYLPTDYMALLMLPAHDAITSVIPGASVFGPELWTCTSSGGDECAENQDHNWGYYTSWTHDWAWALLGYFDQYFPRFTFHSYTFDDWGQRTSAGALWDHVMVPLHKERPMWTTEMNFENPADQNHIADFTCKTYKTMTWERAFYFDLVGNPTYELLTTDPGNPPRWIYDAFSGIVAGNYYCQ